MSDKKVKEKKFSKSQKIMSTYLRLKETSSKNQVIISIILSTIGVSLLAIYMNHSLILEEYNKVFNKPKSISSVKIKSDIGSNHGKLKIIRRKTNLTKGTEIIYVKHDLQSKLLDASGTIAYFYKYNFLDETWEYVKEKRQKDFKMEYNILGEWMKSGENEKTVVISFDSVSDSGQSFEGRIRIDNEKEENFTAVINENDFWGSLRLLGVKYDIDNNEGYTRIEVPYDSKKEYLNLPGDYKLHKSNEQDLQKMKLKYASENILGDWYGLIKDEESNKFEGLNFNFEKIIDGYVYGTMTAIRSSSRNIDFSEGTPESLTAEYDYENDQLSWYAANGEYVSITFSEDPNFGTLAVLESDTVHELWMSQKYMEVML